MMAEVVHGGVRREEIEALGVDPLDVIDLSASLNPFGPHPHVVQSARDADIRRYPESHAETLRGEIAAHAGLKPEQVLVTPGTTAALHLVARAFLREGDPCAIWPPTFGEYAAAIQAAGGTVVEYRSEGAPFAPDIEVTPVPVGFFCNPNNPTGTYLERAAVERLAERLQGLLVLDVAYDSFVEEAWDADHLVRAGLDVLVMHSMTKLHAVPGIRLGYVTGSAARIERLAALQPSWSVDATALAAGHAMLAVDGVQRQAMHEVARVRGIICGDLATRGLEVVEGRANFVLVHVGEAAAVRLALLRRGFATRDCASFGLPEWIRIAVPAEAAARRMLTALHAALAETRR